jgi:hypothetical protein
MIWKLASAIIHAFGYGIMLLGVVALVVLVAAYAVT